jgi:hypothetical protein
VIKIERPGEGDEVRYAGLQLDPERTDQSAYFARMNAGKQSIAIDLAQPQGREVAGLIMISPPFVAKGVQFSPMLASAAVGRNVPVLVIAGRGDRDASKVFDALKRQRPDAWFDSRFPPGNDRGASPVSAEEASLLMFTGQADRTADALAVMRAPRGDPAALIQAFVKIVNARSS